MIFVTVGTHEQQFNRLVECVDLLVEKGIITEEVIIQTGYSTYIPKYCKGFDILPYSDMQKYISDARIIISHGGPSSFIAALQIGKVPIVVPRQKKFDEHVNDHQVNFCRQVYERMGAIYLVEDVDNLDEAINNYDDVIKSMRDENISNNERFNEELGKIVEEMFKS